MTPEEAKYFLDQIDKKIAEALSALTTSQQQQGKAKVFAEKYMQRITGQQFVPQDLFRKFLKDVDYSNVEEAIEAAEAATAAVNTLREKVRETEEGLGEAVTAIENLLVALTALRGKIAEVEQAIPEVTPYDTETVERAIDNHETDYYTYMSDLDVREVMIRHSEDDTDEKEGVDQPIYCWITDETHTEIFTLSEHPEEGDKIYYYINNQEAGIVEEAPNV